MSSSHTSGSCVAIVFLAAAVAAAQPATPAQAPTQRPSGASAGPGPQTGRTVGADQKLTVLTLVRSAGTRAVVRFGSGPLETVTKGDRLGSSGASVVDVATGRLVLEELARTADGAPNRTLIVLKDGQTGGTRYLAQPDEKLPLAVRPVVIDPPKPKSPALPPKKPDRRP